MIKEKEDVFITTTDNPYDPSLQFDEWFAFDSQKNYFTCSLLDRIYNTVLDDPSFDSKTKTDDEIYLEAMKRIVEMNPILYEIVTKTVLINELPINVDEVEKELEKDPTFN